MAAFGIGGAVGSMAMASRPMPRRYLTVMNLLWGLGALPFVVMGVATAVWQLVVAALVLGALWSAPMVIWGTLLQRRLPPHIARSRVVPGLLRLDQPDAGVDGPGRSGLRDSSACARRSSSPASCPGSSPQSRSSRPGSPADEIAHPLRDDPDQGPEQDLDKTDAPVEV